MLWFCNTKEKVPSDLIVASCNLVEIRRFFEGKWKMVVFPVHTMKAYRGRRRIAPLILDPGPRCSEWSTLRPGHVNPGKEPRYPMNRWLGWTAEQVWAFLEKKNAGTRTPSHPANSWLYPICFEEMCCLHHRRTRWRQDAYFRRWWI